MWNLCDNAVKYASETGGILVEIQAGRMTEQRTALSRGAGLGLGVDPATADKIFEPFFTARSGGTGLGLYISREFCELNRATLLYLDRPGGGSIFRIVFADPDRWERQDDTMKQPLALVIDDEPDICELLTLTLGRMDIHTETARTSPAPRSCSASRTSISA